MMKMNTQHTFNLQVSMEELVGAFNKLPANADKLLSHFSVKFTVADDYGNPIARDLLFTWDETTDGWELNAKGHDLLITAKSH